MRVGARHCGWPGATRSGRAGAASGARDDPLPVLAVTAAAVVRRPPTSAGSRRPAHDGRGRGPRRPLGGTVIQAPDPDAGRGPLGERRLRRAAHRGRLGCSATTHGHPIRRRLRGSGWATAGRVMPTGVDLADPLAAGLFDLETRAAARGARRGGRQRRDVAEGVAVGDDPRRARQDVTVVGIGRDATYRDHAGRRRPGGRPSAPTSTNAPEWLVGGGRCSGRRCASSTSTADSSPRAPCWPTRPRRRMAEQMGYDTGQRRAPRRRRADRRDGAARGRAARRPGVRRRCPPAGAHARADGRLRWHTRARRGGWCSPAASCSARSLPSSGWSSA